MSQTVPIGHFYITTITATPAPAAPAPGAVSASSSSNAVAVAHSPVDKDGNAADNAFKVTAVAQGNASVTYTAAGFSSVSESVIVPAPPQLVAADGPVV